MTGRDGSSEWTSRVIEALARGLAVDPSLLAHRTRGELLDRFRTGPGAPASLLVPFPVAHLWAMARVDPGGVHSYVLSHQTQLPLLDHRSYPPSLQAAAEWIRREPWVHGTGGRAALRESLGRLAETSWDMATLDVGVDTATADDLALVLCRACEGRQIPLLSFSDVYRSCLQATGRTVIEAPGALSATLFHALGVSTSATSPRIVLPASILGHPQPAVLGQLLAGAQVVFSWPART